MKKEAKKAIEKMARDVVNNNWERGPDAMRELTIGLAEAHGYNPLNEEEFGEVHDLLERELDRLDAKAR